jgi:hypothetical protein
MTVREYAAHERISLGTAYRRLWEGRVPAMKHDGCWIVTPDAPETNTIQRDSLLHGNSLEPGGEM